MSSYPGDERWAAQQAEQRARRAATVSDEQLARLVTIADADSEHVFEMEDYHALELALRELQMRRLPLSTAQAAQAALLAELDRLNDAIGGKPVRSDDIGVMEAQRLHRQREQAEARERALRSVLEQIDSYDTATLFGMKVLPADVIKRITSEALLASPPPAQEKS